MSLLIFSTTVRANEDVVSIEKGKAAPFSGLLFTNKKANEIRREVLELDKTRIMLESRNERLEIFQSRLKLRDEEIELYRRQNERLIKQNNSNKSVGSVERMVWFGLGILATAGAVYGAGALSR